MNILSNGNGSTPLPSNDLTKCYIFYGILWAAKKIFLKCNICWYESEVMMMLMIHILMVHCMPTKPFWSNSFAFNFQTGENKTRVQSVFMKQVNKTMLKANEFRSTSLTNWDESMKALFGIFRKMPKNSLPFIDFMAALV